MKYELQRIISGANTISQSAIIQAAAGYLKASPRASFMAKESKQNKAQEAEILKTFISQNKLWLPDIPFHNYVSEGAEQKVYLKDEKNVSKLNDIIYYNSWVDYFHSLLLHNYFFSDTAYQLEGFYIGQDVLMACVSQPFVKATEPTNLESVKIFMTSNGFVNTRNHDYYNSELGIILEDLHDENVLTVNGILHFIDTVFYLNEIFYKP
ncbi:MAG: hypothetical protein ABI855_11625 [Bacteroidota bacterium]